MNADLDNPAQTPEGEPTAGFAQAPVWLFVLIAGLAYWGMDFLDRRGGGFHPKVYEPFESFKVVADLQPKSKTGILFDKGRKIFGDNCQVCHQVTGTGLPSQFPPLAGSEWVLAPGPNRLVRIVLYGLQGPISVRGTEWNNQMPNIGFMANFSDETIAALLTFIRGNEAWGNNASPVTPEQVKAVRDQIVGRTDMWSVPDLLKIPEQ